MEFYFYQFLFYRLLSQGGLHGFESDVNKNYKEILFQFFMRLIDDP